MRIFLGILAISLAAPAFAVEKTTARTAYGEDVQVEINRAAVPGQAVVIAPGEGYHMDLPILAELAETLANNGFTAYRFNWNYFTKDPQNGDYSPGYKYEIQDMQAAVALAKADPSNEKVFVAGKSLGSLVSYRVFQQDGGLRGLALLTPICTARYDDQGQPLPAPIPAMHQNYPGLLALGRPVALATSNQDPNCDQRMLAEFLQEGGSHNIPVKVVGGNHSWDVTKGTDDASKALNAENRKKGIGFVVGWLKSLL